MAEPIGAIGGLQGLVPTEGTTGTAAVAAVAPQNATPFQVMLDTALQGLDNVSATEEKANAYIAQYAKGNVSMEEVMIEMTKMTTAVELATTVVNQSISTFKEIQQMPI